MTGTKSQKREKGEVSNKNNLGDHFKKAGGKEKKTSSFQGRKGLGKKTF